MELKLYRVPGISKTDTPYFATSAAQLAYFESKRLATIKPNDFYYPPFYEDVIKVEWDTFRLYTSLNYASFNFKGLECYYFIKDIRYLNESVWELHLEMDVFQTFYFSINLRYAVCERRHIDRWVKKTPTSTEYIINREYIRENFSSGDYKLQPKVFIKKIPLNMTNSNMFDSNGKYLGPWLVAKVLKLTKDTNDNHPVDINFYRQSSQQGAMDGYLLFAPLYRFGDYRYKYWIDATSSYKSKTSDEAKRAVGGLPLYDVMASVDVVDMFVIKDLPVSHELQSYFKFEVSSGYWTYANNSTYSTQETNYSWGNSSLVVYNKRFCIGGFAGLELEEAIQYNNLDSAILLCRTASFMQYESFNIRDKITSYLYNIPIRNTTVGARAQNNFEPSLYDENYQDIVYGTISTNTRYPLHLIKDPSSGNNLKGRFYTDLGSGNFMYQLYEASVTDYDDMYSTLVVDTERINLPMVNSAYANYVSQNRSRWVSAGLEDSMTVVGSLAKIGLQSYAHDAAITDAQNEIANNPHSLTKVRKNLKASAIRSIAKLEGERTSDVYSTIGNGISKAKLGAGASVLFTEYNTKFMPTTSRQTGDYFTDAYTGINDVYIQYGVVRDFVACANKYKMYGNKVNELWSSSTNTALLSDLFTSYNRRYYYNYFKFSDISLDLSYFDSQNLKGLLENILFNGIRLWNVANRDVIGDYSLDNVERSFVS